MKIAELKTWVVGTPPPHHGGTYWIFLKLTTDNGISGYGEVRWDTEVSNQNDEIVARIRHVQRLIGLNAPAAPPIALIRVELFLAACHEDLISGLLLPATPGLELPAQPWAGHVDAQRINQVFTSQVGHS